MATSQFSVVKSFWLFGVLVDCAFYFLLEIRSKMKETMIMEIFASSKTRMCRGFRHAHILSSFGNQISDQSKSKKFEVSLTTVLKLPDMRLSIRPFQVWSFLLLCAIKMFIESIVSSVFSFCLVF